MKTHLYFIFVLFLSTFCTKDEDPILNITDSYWYLERMNYGGSVHLTIQGSTNADKLTIKTFGDGDISESNIELDSKNRFNDDIIISFSFRAVPTEEFEISTEVKAYKGTKSLQTTLTSGKLKY